MQRARTTVFGAPQFSACSVQADANWTHGVCLQQRATMPGCTTGALAYQGAQVHMPLSRLTRTPWTATHYTADRLQASMPLPLRDRCRGASGSCSGELLPKLSHTTSSPGSIAHLNLRRLQRDSVCRALVLRVGRHCVTLGDRGRWRRLLATIQLLTSRHSRVCGCCARSPLLRTRVRCTACRTERACPVACMCLTIVMCQVPATLEIA